ncbi:MAG: YqhA family protein [Thermoanaerobaculia bacterium]|nr:YqhA family protein [Thermoanaerobaculia bacterium]
MNRPQNDFETLLVKSRFILAPIFLTLIVATVLVLFLAGFELVEAFVGISEAWKSPDTLAVKKKTIIGGILDLVDLSLIAALVWTVAITGYKKFVSELNTQKSEDDKIWSEGPDFFSLKLRLMGVMVVISGIELLKYSGTDKFSPESGVFWKVIIHLAFVISCLLFAISDYVHEGNNKKDATDGH